MNANRSDQYDPMTQQLRRLAEGCFHRKRSGKFEIALPDASDDFLLQLARMHFQEGNAWHTVKLESLAQSLGEGYNPTQISRLLEEGERRKLFSVKFETPLKEIRGALIKRYPNLDVRICAGNASKDVVVDNLGRAASDLFAELIDENATATVAVGGGWSLFAMMESVKEVDRDIKVVPLTLFSRGDSNSHTKLRDAPFIAMALTWKSRCFGTICAVPPLPDGEKGSIQFTDKLFAMCPALQEVISTAAKADIVFCAAASLEHESYFEKLYGCAGISLDTLKQNGCVGHLNFSALDKDGNDLSLIVSGKRPRSNDPLRHPFLAAMGMTYFRKLVSDGKIVVLVAAGVAKVPIIKAALDAESVNVLVTDAQTAIALVGSQRH